MLRIPKYQLYLLQLENYEIRRFWKLLFARGLWPKGELRKSLVWTQKAKAVFIVAEVIIFILAALIAVVAYRSILENPVAAWIVAIGLVIILKLFSFLFYTAAVWLLYPVDHFLKKRIVGKAREKLTQRLDPGYFSDKAPKNSGMEKHPLTIIGIAGSYGKTTMKEVLAQVLGVRYKVLATPESVNTPVGIGRWILKELKDDVQVLVVEMGEHYRGDIKDICDIVKPDISVITGINEAHLERFGNLNETAATIFEVAEFAKPDAVVVINAESVLAVQQYQKYVSARSVLWYSAHPSPLSNISVSESVFNERELEQSFSIGSESFTTKLLGEYAAGDVLAAFMIGQRLGMSVSEIKLGVRGVKPVEHRLQPIVNPAGLVVIDDSYNGNPDGVIEAIRLLSKFTKRRKIFLTPGLVETGEKAAEVHRQIGRRLASVADVVILIKNSVTPFIEEGIKNYTTPQPSAVPLLGKEGSGPKSPPGIGGVPSEAGGGGRPQVIWFNTAQEAHKRLAGIVKPNDVVLFQNDWGDNYL